MNNAGCLATVDKIRHPDGVEWNISRFKRVTGRDIDRITRYGGEASLGCYPKQGLMGHGLSEKMVEGVGGRQSLSDQTKRSKQKARSM